MPFWDKFNSVEELHLTEQDLRRMWQRANISEDDEYQIHVVSPAQYEWLKENGICQK
jgi:hypothetical protein